jgi:hypothetical protein
MHARTRHLQPAVEPPEPLVMHDILERTDDCFATFDAALCMQPDHRILCTEQATFAYQLHSFFTRDMLKVNTRV